GVWLIGNSRPVRLKIEQPWECKSTHADQSSKERRKLWACSMTSDADISCHCVRIRANLRAETGGTTGSRPKTSTASWINTASTRMEHCGSKTSHLKRVARDGHAESLLAGSRCALTPEGSASMIPSMDKGLITGWSGRLFSLRAKSPNSNLNARKNWTTASDSLARPNGNWKTKNGSVSWQRGSAGAFIHPMRGSCTVAWGSLSPTSVIGLEANATAQAVGLIFGRISQRLIAGRASK